MQIIEKILPKVEENAARLNGFPHITNNGKWQTTPDGYWTGGFWIGLLWLCCQLSQERKYAKLAYDCLKRLEGRKNDRTFDLGFLFYPSFVLGHQMAGDDSLKKAALEAADTLCRLFHPKAGFVYNEVNFEERKIGRTVIDVMMNLPLLWWAYQETGDSKYFQPAYQHCLSTIESLLRKDYSVIHALDFDLDTGKTIRKITIQGYSDDSCWSRGQAWAIYGFTLAYETSQHERFMEIAENLADYFIKNLPSDYVPYWDFDDPKRLNSARDSSAAAIACSGLLTLFELSQKQELREAAMNILNSLSTDYLANGSEGILQHGCFHKPLNLGVDESTIWGDYYFAEALVKAVESNEEGKNRC
jgi:unsaturated chondroitin disaccharide hydrolase